MHAVVVVAAAALTLASVACTVAPTRHGGAAAPRERAAGLLMGVSTLDMAIPGLDVLHAVGWGAALVPAALGLLLPGRGGAGRSRGGAGASAAPPRRAELAWHAGSLVLMSAMWWTMAGHAVEPVVGRPASGGGHASHDSGVPLAWTVAAAAGLLAIVAVAGALRRATGDRMGPSAWRHPLMAVGMLLMATSMPLY